MLRLDQHRPGKNIKTQHDTAGGDHIVNIRQLLAVVTAAAAFGTAASANAALVTDCPVTAIVCYEYDNAQAAVALTGLPTRVGDDMQFTPASFLALSNGAGFVTAGPANFVFSRVWTPGGQEIASLTVNEEFDYEIVNGGDVRATLYMQARSNLVSSDSLSNLWSLPIAGDSGGPQIANLSGTLLTAANFVQAANDMRVTIQDTLRANAGAGQLAWIQKKFTLVTETVVPVPAAVWLLDSGLGLLGMARRRQLIG